ncbi:Protein of unknown function [Chryseobacterium soldanellicola]|uniref:DUF1761 domain-containing protein n=1 Tax=Chryseobacterium soldanellicola TaxID=311333 RepID=A0A1H1DQ33_9FLAO|nr:DUF1761 domain-containing protein [Chryseobacterium soldanellicola]SDQ78547.1 Protein of unknown function [Chryseobacterium soldanellicola]
MVQINFWAILVAALVPLIMGFIWYNPKVFGIVWMKEAGLTEEKMQGGNMGFVFVFAFILSLFVAFFLQMVTIHQYGAMGMMGGDEMNAKPSYFAFMKDYGMAYRSFGHGALHSFIMGIFFVFPLTAINAMFERKSWKYTFINTAYWTLTITIMGGIVCGWYAIDGFNLVTPK